MLSNLKEIYCCFIEKNPGITIGFSKFADLRPKNCMYKYTCILVGTSGAHSVCVCTIHQNVKLMITGCKLSQLTANHQYSLTETYQDCIAKIIYNPPCCFFFDSLGFEFWISMYICKGFSNNCKDIKTFKREKSMIEKLLYIEIEIEIQNSGAKLSKKKQHQRKHSQTRKTQTSSNTDHNNCIRHIVSAISNQKIQLLCSH